MQAPHLSLPARVAGFFTAYNAGNAAEVAAHFADDAVVVDEGNTMHGIAAIQGWVASTRDKYSATLAPLAIAEVANVLTVMAEVRGNFDGSPITLRFRFTFDQHRINKLEILV